MGQLKYTYYQPCLRISKKFQWLILGGFVMSLNNQKEWSNPSAAGLVALAVACYIFFALLSGRLGTKPGELNALPLIAGWLFGGFVIQFITALIDLKGGNHVGGNTFLFFSAFFMLSSSIGMAMKSFVPYLDARVDGYVFLVLSITIWLWAPAFYKGNPFLFYIIVLLGVACPILAICDLKLVTGVTAKSLANFAAYVFLVIGTIGMYAAGAIVVNTAYGKELFPVPKPL